MYIIKVKRRRRINGLSDNADFLSSVLKFPSLARYDFDKRLL